MPATIKRDGPGVSLSLTTTGMRLETDTDVPATGEVLWLSSPETAATKFVRVETAPGLLDELGTVPAGATWIPCSRLPLPIVVEGASTIKVYGSEAFLAVAKLT